MPIQQLIIPIQEWDYFIILPMVLNQDNIGVIIHNMFMEVLEQISHNSQTGMPQQEQIAQTGVK